MSHFHKLSQSVKKGSEKLPKIIENILNAGYRHGEFEEPPKSTDDSDRRITDYSDKRSFYSQSRSECFDSFF